MEIIIGLLAIVFVVIVLRFVGAWMLRIDEVIKLQKDMLLEMKKINNNTPS